MNPIRRAFLEAQHRDVQHFAAESDLLSVEPLGLERMIATFVCTGLVLRDGGVRKHELFRVGLRFPDDYLHTPDPSQVITWLYPLDVFHPNLHPPFVCAGPITGGTGAIELLYRIHEVIVWGNVNMREDDSLNVAACSWARRHLDLFPVDSRPLKWRAPHRGDGASSADSAKAKGDRS
jgi:hypothetical protein